MKRNASRYMSVSDNEMESATHATYLEDVISETGKFDETVLQKATDITSQITSMLSNITL